MQDAKMVTVHCGVSNLRDKETTSSMIKRLAERITSLKEALPEIKIAVSTPTPVGERKLEIERNIFNAEAEKQLLDILDDKVFFIDHSNLSDRGSAIKDFYREDEIHLSRNGTHQFRRNLKAVITETLKMERKSYQKEIGKIMKVWECRENDNKTTESTNIGPKGADNTTIIAGGNQGSMKIGIKEAGNSTIMDEENQGSTYIGPNGADIMTIMAGGNRDIMKEWENRGDMSVHGTGKNVTMNIIKDNIDSIMVIHIIEVIDMTETVTRVKMSVSTL